MVKLNTRNTGAGQINFDVTVEGDDAFTAAIAAAIESSIQSVIGPMVMEAETIMGRSKEIVPLDLNTLRASADEVGVAVERGGDTITVSFGYGGAASAYSIVQHENPDFRHAPGRTWKYLEGPTLEAIEGMEQRLASGMASTISEGDTFDAPTE